MRAPAQLPGASGPQPKRLKRGDKLFTEGESSRAMYLIKSGMLRIFKKKGDSSIEIDTVRSGQIVGELAFLDGNPRSASGEALTDCELLEISGPAFEAVLSRLPDWLKILLKTVVGRLRTASTRIRQLETASSQAEYGADGKKTSAYTYLPIHEALKISTGILLAASRYGKPGGGGIEISLSLVQRFVNQIMGVPSAKITSLIDVYNQATVTQSSPDGGISKLVVMDVDFLDKFIGYLNEENLLDPSKRHEISPKGFTILGLMVKHLANAKKDEKTGFATLNLAEIRKKESGPSGKEPFKLDDFKEIVRLGYASNVQVLSNDDVATTVKTDSVTLHYRFQKMARLLDALNQSKRR